MTCARRPAVVVVALTAPWFCACEGPALARGEPEYRAAAARSAAGDLDGAVDALRRACDTGLAAPSRVLGDPAFRGLSDDPAARRSLHELLARHAREAAITMVRPDEPGQPLELTITVVAESGGAPIVDAVVEIVHVDARGLYQDDDETWNPRLFGFARTDPRGRVTVRTIRPAHYAPEYEGDDHPAHVHYTVTADGYRPFGGEILFDDDPRLTAGARTEAAGNGFPICPVEQSESAGRPQRCAVVIRLQRE